MLQPEEGIISLLLLGSGSLLGTLVLAGLLGGLGLLSFKLVYTGLKLLGGLGFCLLTLIVRRFGGGSNLLRNDAAYFSLSPSIGEGARFCP